MADISLTASMRSNLLSLQQTQSLMDMTQERLSTGKKVNSAIDNPSSYYAAQSLTNRASDLGALMDSMGQAIQTIKAADEGIKTITEFAEQAKAVANSARDEASLNKEGKITLDGSVATSAATDGIVIKINGVEKTINTTEVTAGGGGNAAVKTALAAALKADAAIEDATVETDGSIKIVAAAGSKIEVVGGVGDFADKLTGTVATTPTVGEVSEARQKMSDQFNNIMDQINKVAKDSSYKGVNLLQGNKLNVVFNEDRSSFLEVEGKDASATGLKISDANGWQKDTDIDNSISQIEAAVKSLRTMSSEFGNNYSIVQSRTNFTENLIGVLEEGSDNLTLADMNEESANMLALQTRQQLAINSLSLASQAAQSVLKLF